MAKTVSSDHYEHIVTGTLHLFALDQQVYKANVTDGYAVENGLSKAHPRIGERMNYC